MYIPVRYITAIHICTSSLQNALISSVVQVSPSLSLTQAQTSSPILSSGIPITCTEGTVQGYKLIHKYIHTSYVGILFEIGLKRITMYVHVCSKSSPTITCTPEYHLFSDACKETAQFLLDICFHLRG